MDARLPGFAYEPCRPLDFNGVLTTRKDGGRYISDYIPARSIPHPDGWFETVWDAYRRRSCGE